MGIKAVQEAQAAIAHYRASAAWVVSNRYYTEAAKELAHSNKVRLVDRDGLIHMILAMKDGQAKAAQAPQTVPPNHIEVAATSDGTQLTEELICPRCGAPMVKRNGSRGEFYGCSNFPKCRMIRAI